MIEQIIIELIIVFVLMYYVVTLLFYGFIHHLDVTGRFSRPFPFMAWFLFLIGFGLPLSIGFTIALIFKHHVDLPKKGFDVWLFGEPKFKQ